MKLLNKYVKFFKCITIQALFPRLVIRNYREIDMCLYFIEADTQLGYEKFPQHKAITISLLGFGTQITYYRGLK